MELRGLRSLAMLAESGSLVQSARGVGLSPAAVHKQLKCLETELGERLYEKAGRRLQLTPAGEILLPYVKDLLAQYEAAVSALEEWKGLKRGVVRIGSGPTLSSYILPLLLRQFRRSFSHVDLLVETGHTPALLRSLTSGSLDLALVVSSELLAEPNFSLEAFWDFEFALVSNLRQAPRRCALAELHKYPFVLFQKGSRMESVIDRYFIEMDFHPRVVMRFDNADAIKAMIRTGLGISMLPLWSVDADLRRGALHLIRQRERPLVSKIVLVSRKSSYVPRPVNAFINLAQTFRFRRPRLRSHAP